MNTSVAVEGPPQVVLNLAPAEREVALLVYQLGGCTAKDVQDRLDKRVTNATVRTMLRRLMKKGMIARERGGSYKSYIYVPALTNEFVRQSAIIHLAREYFSGSLPELAVAVEDLLDLHAPTASRRSAFG
jgi:predicted transcriptional regulator